MNTHQIKLVAFDFDGVIAETIKEWYFLGLKAFNHMGGDLPSSKEVGDSFRQARSFLKNAEDCYFVFKSIKEGSVDFRTMTQERFNQLSQPFFEKFLNFEMNGFQISNLNSTLNSILNLNSII